MSQELKKDFDPFSLININSLEGVLLRVRDSIAGIQERIETNEVTLKHLEEAKRSTSLPVDNVKERDCQKVLTDLEAKYNTLSKNMNQLSKCTESYMLKLDNLRETVFTLEGVTEKTKGEIELKVRTDFFARTEANALKQRISRLTEDVSSIFNTLTRKVSRSEICEIEGKLNQVENFSEALQILSKAVQDQSKHFAEIKGIYKSLKERGAIERNQMKINTELKEVQTLVKEQKLDKLLGFKILTKDQIEGVSLRVQKCSSELSLFKRTEAKELHKRVHQKNQEDENRDHRILQLETALKLMTKNLEEMTNFKSKVNTLSESLSASTQENIFFTNQIEYLKKGLTEERTLTKALTEKVDLLEKKNALCFKFIKMFQPE
eukprot:snap_masked-scaffold_48-processed-gene-1.58-mRNA-1 protein AED:1.00 eAED:1.00 QI:0/0/0/0/1/1/3/0/377